MAKKKKRNNPSLLTIDDPWENNSNAIWLASSLKFYRNLNRFKFPGKLSVAERNQVVTLLERALANVPTIKNQILIPAEKLTPIEKEYLFEHFLSVGSIHQAHTGEAFLVDKAGELLAVINVRDHLQLQRFNFSSDLEGTLGQLVEEEARLSKELTFAFSDRFGYLAADPAHAGTGLVIDLFLQLPALIQTEKLEKLLEEICAEGVEVSGLQGTPGEYLGDILRLQNSRTLGLNEESILAIMRQAAVKLSSAEQALRKEFQKGSAAVLKDGVSRAFGLLTHSYQIETMEALDALSLLKLGVDIGWVDKSSIKELNNLFFACRRGSLLLHEDTEPDLSEISKMRANFIRAGLKNTSLVI